MVAPLTISARNYCESRGIRPTPVYSANRFARMIGDLPPKTITLAHLAEFQAAMERQSLSAWTVKGALKDVRTICRDCGNNLHVPPVRVPQPEPEPTSVDDLNAIWPHLATWSKQSVVLMYHCCFRLADILRLQCEGISADATVIRLQAHKTHRNHAFPVPAWLSQYLGPVRLPFACSNDHAATIVRGELDRVSALAKVARVYPRNIRQAGITAWSQANGMAGAIAHGSGLRGSVLQHYVSPLSVLESAAPRVRVPQSMRGDCNSDDTEATLLTHFRRMDPAAQSLISSTAERLSAG